MDILNLKLIKKMINLNRIRIERLSEDKEINYSEIRYIEGKLTILYEIEDFLDK